MTSTNMTKTKNCWIGLRKWLKCVSLMNYWCDGSEEENERLIKLMVDSGLATPLNPEKRPGCYLSAAIRPTLPVLRTELLLHPKPKKMQDLQTTG